MRKFLSTLMLLIALCIPINVFAAAEVSSQILRDKKPLTIVKISWTASGSGAIADSDTGNPIDFPRGMILGVMFVPDATVTGTYDVYLRDANDYDYLNGAGVAVSQTKSDSGNWRSPLSDDGTYFITPYVSLYLNIANVENDSTGTIYILLREYKNQ